MMVELQQILTELVNNVSRIDSQVESFVFPTSEASAIKARETAIANAEKQIRQQERERVEKAKEALIVFGHHKKLCPCLHKSNVWKNKRLICNCGYIAALKELEATDA